MFNEIQASHIFADSLSSIQLLQLSPHFHENASALITVINLWGSSIQHSAGHWWTELGQRGHTGFPLSYFSFQPVPHDWCNKGHGICYPVCGMVHIKEPLLLIEKSSPCGSSGFPLSLYEWSHTICLTPYKTVNKMCWVCR